MPGKNTRKTTGETIGRKTLRLWPGVIILTLQLIVRYGLPVVAPEAFSISVFGGLVGGLLIVLWWLFFSRAPLFERWGGVGLMIAGLFAIRPFLHESIAEAGMGVLFFVYAVPVLCLIFVAWAAFSRFLSDGARRVTMVAAILIGCGGWALVRTSGVTGDYNSDFSWRWTQSPEERLLAGSGDEPVSVPSAPAVDVTNAYWPGFRGPDRDGVIHGVQIETDWSVSPPVELWRRPVGPGWSSFSVSGDRLFTQEQRGEEELVSCYLVTTGELVWMHGDPARFWESNGGAGPRGTPTIAGNRIYALGATGILNVLDPQDGSVAWTRNAATDTDTELPMWGFSSSPLVWEDSVIVAAAGSLISYDLDTGDPRWKNPVGGECYSSPHLATIDGVVQVLLQNEAGISAFDPHDGRKLWEHAWPGNPIVQPTLIGDENLLISVDEKSGIRRIAVSHAPGGWSAEERWTSARLKPYFNDSVAHKGHAYGFDGPLLACVALDDGSRKWRGGRYGRGQFVLLADQDLLLVLSEKGELALVRAVPDGFDEIARFPAIKGKTWNHPVLVGEVLLVRNAQEMAAFRLSPVKR